MRNTKNEWANDRGTKGYSIQVSGADKAAWATVATGTLAWEWQNKVDVACGGEVDCSTANHQYVRFNMLSYYGFGGGLGYFGVRATLGKHTHACF